MNGQAAVLWQDELMRKLLFPYQLAITPCLSRVGHLMLPHLLGLSMSALPPKAATAVADRHVRFGPTRDIPQQAGRADGKRFQQQPQLWPDQASRPSLTKNQTIANEPTPSIHHAPKSH
jgi:hypothetical protein